MRTTDFMRMSHAQAAMKASAIAYENEQLRQQLAEKDAEIARLKYAQENPKFNGRYDTWHVVAGKYRAEAAASQLREQQLRDALFSLVVEGKSNSFEAQQALALPTDTSALEALIAKAGEVMRGRCFNECDADQYPNECDKHIAHACRLAIRALPGVTMEDLK